MSTWYFALDLVKPGEPADVLDIPKDATHLQASRVEFFRVFTTPGLFP